MNVFVLCTGRCGSTTFAKACTHFTNFTSGHHSRSHLLGQARIQYPDNHIEVDNRLSWFLGRLDREYGNDAYYVHLTREPEAVAHSLSKRVHWLSGIARAYRDGIIINGPERSAAQGLEAPKGRKRQPPPPLEAMRDYVQTVTENIDLFLRDKQNVMHIQLENIKSAFPQFCDWVSAEGDLEAAGKEWNERHNATADGSGTRSRLARLMRRVRNWS